MRRETVIAALVGLIVFIQAAAASHATVSGTPTVLAKPETVECLAPPIAFDALSAILATPVPSPFAEGVATTVPAGTPADSSTVVGITATLQEMVACFNAGEVLRAYSLYTPDYLRTIFSNQPPLSGDGYEDRATPQPLDPDERAVIREIGGVRTFADGSAGAYAMIAYPLIPTPKAFFFTFVFDATDVRWLIDGALGEIAFSVP